MQGSKFSDSGISEPKFPFGTLPAELKRRVLHFCLVEPFAVVDPEPLGCYSKPGFKVHPHALLDADILTGRRKSEYSCKEHGLTPFRSRQAASALRASFGPDTRPRRRCLVPAVLATNSEMHKEGMRMLYHENTFLFTTTNALECFIYHQPEAASRIQKIILFMELSQRSGMAAKLVSGGGTSNAQTNQPPLTQNLFYSELVGHPSIVLNGGITDPTNGFSARFASMLQNLTVHFINWRQMECPSSPDEPTDVFNLGNSEYPIPVNNETAPDLATVPRPISNPSPGLHHGLHRDLTTAFMRRLQERQSRPIRFVQGAMPLEWIGRLRRGGWVARTVKITGLEDLEEDKEIVSQMEDDLTSI